MKSPEFRIKILGKTPILPKMRPVCEDSTTLKNALQSLKVGEAVRLQGMAESLVRNISSQCSKELARNYIVRTRLPSIYVWRGRNTRKATLHELPVLT